MSTVPDFTVINTYVAQELEDIFHQYYPLVYRTAFRVTATAEDAEDVVQTIFLRLLRRGLPLGFSENPKAYLFRAAVNVGLNVVRSRQRHVQTPDSGWQDMPDETNRLGPDSPVHGLVAEAVAELNPRVVEMLILRYEHDYTDAEIAELLRKSRGVVAVTLHRARARLKKLLSASLKGQS